jgi:carbon starvation protein
MFQSAIGVTLASFAALLAAYLLYGRFLARHIFRLDANRPTPAHELEDGVDFVPTKVPVLFGHHFASIAGLGPILGPAVAVIWGWVPAVVWVLVGCIFIGGAHDLGSLTVSLRFKGRSVGDVCRELIGPRARLLFLFIIFFLMSLAMGAFVNAISSLFVNFNPDAIIPSFGLMLVAMAIGVAVYRYKVGLGPATIIGLLAFGGLIYLGVQRPVPSHEWFIGSQTAELLEAGRDSGRLTAPYGAADAMAYLESLESAATEPNATQSYVTDSPFDAAAITQAIEDLRQAASGARFRWILVLLAYGFIASVLPVWLLLQPRDYINSFQLYAALALLVIGLGVASWTGAPESQIHAAAFRQVADAPPMLPFLMVTIACGAVSGFHSLVSSGTTVRQLNRETDALPIGFGAMMTEGALAILVIMACVAGLGAKAWGPEGIYASWSGGISSKGQGLGNQLSAVVDGGANFFAQLGVNPLYGQAFLAVTIVAFAMTTLDSATRLLRFNVEEIFRSLRLEPLANRYVASLCAVGGIAFFGLSKGGSTLWVLFGTTNQLLAGLALLTVSIFLFKLRRPVWYTLLPMAIMLLVSIAAMLHLLVYSFIPNQDLPLTVVSLIILGMTLWLVLEGVLAFTAGRDAGSLPWQLTDEPSHDHEVGDVIESTHLG